MSINCYFSPHQEADIAMGAITRTALRETGSDFSYPCFISMMGFFTRKPSAVPRFFAPMWPYGRFVWISLAATIPAFALVVWTFSKIDKAGFRSNFNFGTALQQVSQMLVMQGVFVNGRVGEKFLI